MADARFFRPAGRFALGALATLAEARLVGGDPQREITDVAPLESAGPDQVTFLDNARYLDQAATTRAAACLIRPQHADRLPDDVARLLTTDPYRGYARVAAAFYPEAAAPGADHPPVPEIAAGALIDPAAILGAGCRVAAGAVIEAGAELGPRCRIAANAVIGAGVALGPDCRIGPGATLNHCLLGSRVVVHAGARIGQDGFGFAPAAQGHLKVPQIGRVVIGDDVEIGANTTVDRGSGPDTVIGRGCKIDNLVMIAHNVSLGEDCIVVAQMRYLGQHRDRRREHPRRAGRDHRPSQRRCPRSAGRPQRRDPRSACGPDLRRHPSDPDRPVAAADGGDHAAGQTKGGEG